MSHFPATRLRRLRYQPAVRNLVRETKLQVDELILPLFIKSGQQIKNPIASMPGHFQLSVDNLKAEVDSCLAVGVKKFLLFGLPAHKDALGTDSYQETGIIQTAVKILKKTYNDILIITDVCFCEYTDHGHCGVVHHQTEGSFEIDNDATLVNLAKQAVSHAQAGADIIAPSGMMDGGVQAIRAALDKAGYHQIPILNYAVKYASALYGPFRAAAEGGAQFGDRRSHQMDPANTAEALRECELDIQEGVDMLMVKPAHTYLDVIHRIKNTYPALPLGAYHTSGEYAFIKAASEKGWVDEKQVALEVLTAIRRAGADFIITYYAKEVANWLAQKK